MAFEGRIRRLAASVPRPDPEAENFRRQGAILNELERLLSPERQPGEPYDTDPLVEAAVPGGLAKYGLSQEEIDEVGPDYVEMFKDIFRELAEERKET